MPRSMRSSLTASARLGAIVAGTALVTAAVVGGGAVAVQTVGKASPVTGDPAAGPDEKPDKKDKGQGAAKRSDQANAVHERKRAAAAAAAAVPFVCDPTKTHGQNVSAYVHSLPKGPGRGALVSQAAKSDCGKQAEGAQEEAKAEQPEKAAKPDKPEKTAPGAAGEPQSAEPQSIEPQSAEPKSVDPKSTDPKPTEPKSVDPNESASPPPSSPRR